MVGLGRLGSKHNIHSFLRANKLLDEETQPGGAGDMGGVSGGDTNPYTDNGSDTASSTKKVETPPPIQGKVPISSSSPTSPEIYPVYSGEGKITGYINEKGEPTTPYDYVSDYQKVENINPYALVKIEGWEEGYVTEKYAAIKAGASKGVWTMYEEPTGEIKRLQARIYPELATLTVKSGIIPEGSWTEKKGGQLFQFSVAGAREIGETPLSSYIYKPYYIGLTSEGKEVFGGFAPLIKKALAYESAMKEGKTPAEAYKIAKESLILFEPSEPFGAKEMPTITNTSPISSAETPLQRQIRAEPAKTSPWADILPEGAEFEKSTATAYFNLNNDIDIHNLPDVGIGMIGGTINDGKPVFNVTSNKFEDMPILAQIGALPKGGGSYFLQKEAMSELKLKDLEKRYGGDFTATPTIGGYVIASTGKLPSDIIIRSQEELKIEAKMPEVEKWWEEASHPERIGAIIGKTVASSEGRSIIWQGIKGGSPEEPFKKSIAKELSGREEGTWTFGSVLYAAKDSPLGLYATAAGEGFILGKGLATLTEGITVGGRTLALTGQLGTKGKVGLGLMLGGGEVYSFQKTYEIYEKAGYTPEQIKDVFAEKAMGDIISTGGMISGFEAGFKPKYTQFEIGKTRETYNKKGTYGADIKEEVPYTRGLPESAKIEKMIPQEPESASASIKDLFKTGEGKIFIKGQEITSKGALFSRPETSELGESTSLIKGKLFPKPDLVTAIDVYGKQLSEALPPPKASIYEKIGDEWIAREGYAVTPKKIVPKEELELDYFSRSGVENFGIKTVGYKRPLEMVELETTFPIWSKTKTSVFGEGYTVEKTTIPYLKEEHIVDIFGKYGSQMRIKVAEAPYWGGIAFTRLAPPVQKGAEASLKMSDLFLLQETEKTARGAYSTLLPTMPQKSTEGRATYKTQAPLISTLTESKSKTRQAPIIFTEVIPQARERVKPIIFQMSKPEITIKEKPIVITDVAPKIGQKEKPIIIQSISPLPQTKEKPITILSLKPEPTNGRQPKPSLFFPIIPPIPPISKKTDNDFLYPSTKALQKLTRRFKYEPTIYAKMFGITAKGKQPTLTTGFDVRPVYIGGGKKRRKRGIRI